MFSLWKNQIYVDQRIASRNCGSGRVEIVSIRVRTNVGVLRREEIAGPIDEYSIFILVRIQFGEKSAPKMFSTLSIYPGCVVLHIHPPSS